MGKLRGAIWRDPFASNVHAGRLTLRYLLHGGGEYLYLQAVMMEAIEKLGAWKGDVVNPYLYLDDVVYRENGAHLKPGRGMLLQLKRLEIKRMSAQTFARCVRKKPTKKEPRIRRNEVESAESS